MSVKLLADLALLWIAVLVVAVVLFGWGNLIWKSVGIVAPKNAAAMTTWLGFCGVLLALESIHLMFSIDWKVSLSVTAIGVVGLRGATTGSRNLSLKGVSIWLRQRISYVIVLALAFCFWSLRATEVPIAFDAGLYHFASIRWLNEEPIVPGLANVHWRLALNQSYFGFIALLNIAPFWDRGYAASGLVLLVLTTLTLFQVAGRSEGIWRYVLLALLFLFVNQLSGVTSNPSPDFVVALLEIVMFLYLFDLISRRRFSFENSSCHVAVLIFLSVALVTVKLSGAAFAAASFILVMYYSLRFRLQPCSVLLRLLVAACLFAAIHVGRNILLSGAPLFPSAVGGLWNLFWAIPPSIAQFETALIYSWARTPGITNLTTNDWNALEWVMSWLTHQPLSWQLSFVLASVSSFLNLCILLISKKKTQSPPFYFLYLPVLSGFIFWFFTAPDIRFLGAVNTLYLALSLGLAAQSLSLISSQEKIERVRYRWALMIRLAPFLGIFVFVLVLIRWTVMQPLSFVGWQPIPQSQIKTITTAWGLQVNVPQEGAQCWNAPKPCASTVYGSLRKIPWAPSDYFYGLLNERYVFTLK